MQLKKLSILATIILILAIAVALSGCTNSASSTEEGLASGLPATLDYSIEVTGGTTPVTLTYADLRAMNLIELNDVSVVNSVGTTTSGDYVGVPLMDIVNKAGLPAGEVSFTAFASDGYNVEYTSEQFNAGILALKTDGTPNTDGFNDQYPISFVFNGGEKNAWIKMPTRIVIHAGAAEQTALFISGDNVTTKKSYSLSQLKNMTAQMKTITTADSKGINITATGVLLNYLLDQVGPKGVNVTFISGDANGYSKNVTLAAIHDSIDAIVAIDENGVLRNIIPGQPSNTWVGNLTKIRVD